MIMVMDDDDDDDDGDETIKAIVSWSLEVELGQSTLFCALGQRSSFSRVQKPFLPEGKNLPQGCLLYPSGREGFLALGGKNSSAPGHNTVRSED